MRFMHGMGCVHALPRNQRFFSTFTLRIGLEAGFADLFDQIVPEQLNAFRMPLLFMIDEIGLEGGAGKIVQDSHQIGGPAHQVFGQGGKADAGLHGLEGTVNIVDSKRRAPGRAASADLDDSVDVSERRSGLRAIDDQVMVVQVFHGLRFALAGQIIG